MNTTTIQYTNNAFTKSLTLLTLLFVALALFTTGVAAADVGADLSVYNPLDNYDHTIELDEVSDNLVLSDEDITSGDEVLLEGTLEGDLIMDVENVVVEGESYENSLQTRIEGQVEVVAEGVEVRGLQVSPDSETIEEKKSGIYIAESDVLVEYNEISGINANAENSEHSSIHGIHVWSAEGISNIEVRNNLVRDIDFEGDVDGEWGDYGNLYAIHIQGNIDGAVVEHNTVQDLWSAGYLPAITSGHTGSDTGDDPNTPRDVKVKYNRLEDIETGDAGDTEIPAVGFEISSEGDASDVSVLYNSFETPVGAVNKDESSTLDATQNYWGSASPDFDSLVEGEVDYAPWYATEEMIENVEVLDGDETRAYSATIQGGVDAAQEGDTIFVESGDYEEAVEVDTGDLTLYGVDDPLVYYMEDDGTPAFSIEAAGVEMQGFEVHRGGQSQSIAQGIRVSASDVLVANNAVRGVSDDETDQGISVLDGYGEDPVETTSNVTLYKNYVHGFPSAVGVATQEEGAGLTDVNIVENTLENNGLGIGVTEFNEDSGKPQNVDIVGNVIDNSGFDEGVGLWIFSNDKYGIKGVADAEEVNASGNTFSGNKIHLLDETGVASDVDVLEEFIEDNEVNNPVVSLKSETSGLPVVYGEIQPAIGDSEEGFEVIVGEGTYEESVTVDVENLNLIGVESPVVDAGGADIGISIESDLGNVTVEGFNVTNWVAGGIGQGWVDYEGTSSHIHNNVITAGDETAEHGNSIQVTGNESTVVGNTLTVTHQVSPDWSASGILVFSASSAYVAHNHVIGEGGDRGIVVGGGGHYGSDDEGLNRPVQDVVVEDNLVEDSEVGITTQSQAFDTVMVNNTIRDNEVGVQEDTVEGLSPQRTLIEDNHISENNVGLEIVSKDDSELEFTGDVISNEFIDNDVYLIDDSGEADLQSILGNNIFQPSAVQEGSTLVQEADVDVINVDMNVGYQTIQEAVEDAEQGHRIEVREGIYEEENIRLNTDGITLTSADSENPAEITHDEGEKDILKVDNDSITVSNIVLTATEAGAIDDSGGKGFMLDSSVVKAASEFDETSIVNIAQPDATIANSTIENQLRLQAGATDATVRGNELENINLNSDAEIVSNSFTGEFVGVTVSGTTVVDDAEIVGNNFSGVVGVALADHSRSVEVSENVFEDTEFGVLVFEGDESAGEENTVTRNKFTGNEHAVSVAGEGHGPADATAVEVNYNNITGNTLGVVNEGSGEIDATRNYWGQPQGPEDSQVEGDVVYTPWLPVPHAQQGVLEIAEENPSVTRGNTQSFSAVVRDGGEEYEVDDVEWSIVSDSAGSEIDGNSVTTGSQGSVDVVAEYVGDELELAVEEATVTLNSEGRTHSPSGTPVTLPDEAEAELPDEAEVDEGEEQEEETDEEETGTGEDATGDTTTDEGTTGDDTTGEQEEDPDTPTGLTGLFLADAPDFLVSLTESISNLLPF